MNARGSVRGWQTNVDAHIEQRATVHSFCDILIKMTRADLMASPKDISLQTSIRKPSPADLFGQIRTGEVEDKQTTKRLNVGQQKDSLEPAAVKGAVQRWLTLTSRSCDSSTVHLKTFRPQCLASTSKQELDQCLTGVL